MAAIVFALSFQEASGTFEGFSNNLLTGEESERRLLGPMTQIFRQAFRSVFSQAMIHEGQRRTIDIGDAAVVLRDAAILRSSQQSAIADDSNNHVLIVLVDIIPVDRMVNAHDLWRARYKTPTAKIALARELGLGGAMDRLRTAQGRIVGQTSALVEHPTAGQEAVSLSIFGFYVSAWFCALRIERRQLDIELKPTSQANSKTNIEIANQRLRILNQQRYYLTTDRTNHPELRSFCAFLSQKFRLIERNSRALELHTAFEHHLGNSTRLYSAARLGSMSNLILLLTLLSVPISVFSAVFAINMNNEALANPYDLLVDYRVYVPLLIGLSFVLLPFVILKLADKWLERRGPLNDHG